MGKLRERHGLTMLGKTPEGMCPMCATAHEPDQPHNQQSLAYQYKFYDEHGRWPTWHDAMDHCSKEMKAFWTAELKKRGVALD